ncbi:hypothetical protein [Saccharopolyspora taberi]|uniref:Uncharacterized protein n=1 Tax=Saccharopolyspora taberi TaxID=60895 RepID=A0ABN3VPZ3_9PSEU
MLSIRELRDRAVIRPIKRAVEDQLLDLPGVTAVDIGEKFTAGRSTGKQVIVVSVASKRPSERLLPGARVPGDVLGIPTDVIEETPVLHHLHTGLHDPVTPRQRRTDRFGAVRGGGGIAPDRTVRLGSQEVPAPGEYRRIGTLGLLVTGNAPATVTMGLTTFDVACLDDAWSVGDRMVDPDVGEIYADLARAALSGRVDAAAVTLAQGVDHSAAIDGIGPITGQRGAYPGEAVRKSGYGTGLTTGIVRSIDTTLRVDHGDALGVRVLREQLRITGGPARFTGPGDAGAAVIDRTGQVVGLLIAGSGSGAAGFASPIADVLAELDVELYTETQRLEV